GDEILTPPRPDPASRCPALAPGAATEHLTQQVAQSVAGVEAERATARPAGAPPEGGTDRAHLADLVVLPAFGLVAGHSGGSRDLLEPLLGAGVTRVGVGVVLARQLAVRLGDVLLRGALLHPEDLVVVLLEPLPLWGHRWCLPLHLHHGRSQDAALPPISGP